MGKFKLDIKSWGDVTIAQSEKIAVISKDESLSDAEKDVAVISLLLGINEEEVWSMEATDITELRSELIMIGNGVEQDNTKVPKKMNVGDFKVKIHKNLDKMTYAQYVDFQQTYKAIDSNKAAFLSVFLIPDGCKYNEGYDLLELQEAIKQNVTINDFNRITFFLFGRLKRSMRVSVRSLAMTLKLKTLMMRKSNPLRQKYKELIAEMLSFCGSIS